MAGTTCARAQLQRVLAFALNSETELVGPGFACVESAQCFGLWLATAERPIDKHFGQNVLVAAGHGRHALQALDYDLRSFGEPIRFAVQNVAGLVAPSEASPSARLAFMVP